MNLASHPSPCRDPLLADLPPEAPLAMPVQDFNEFPIVRPVPSAESRYRRAWLIVGSAIIGFAASLGIASLLAGDGYDAVDQLLALISLALFAWIGFGFLNALAGLVVCIASRRPVGTVPSLPARPVAVLIPIYNEDVAAVAGRVARMMADLAQTGAASLFDFFILSDSQESAEAGERAACRLLRSRNGPRVYYRRRAQNAGRKPGNIADWVRRFGAAYDSMLILDADSRMSGEAMIRLAAAMEADRTLGLIQTTPLLTAGRTIFARWQQFSVALYGPIANAGLSWWSGDEATFWGHNAILRVGAFAESCGLPTLPGPEPLGGEIMSHDMVEAALLRRRGWRTRMMVTPTGSYEECPPTLIDHAVRDRRWCQGNLQHLRLLDVPGFHWISRLQLLMGASAYLTSPLWLLLLTVGMLQSYRTGNPIVALDTPVWLIAATVMLLFGTKLLALSWAMIDRDLVRDVGGWRALLLGVAVDIPLAILMAPIMMASQCLAIVEILSGRPSGWKPQRREAEGVSIVAAFEYYRWHVLLGLPFWLFTIGNPVIGMWQLPVVIGLFGAPLLAGWTSRVEWAERAARYGLFVADPGAPPMSAARTPTRAGPVLHPEQALAAA